MNFISGSVFSYLDHVTEYGVTKKDLIRSMNEGVITRYSDYLECDIAFQHAVFKLEQPNCGSCAKLVRSVKQMLSIPSEAFLYVNAVTLECFSIRFMDRILFQEHQNIDFTGNEITCKALQDKEIHWLQDTHNPQSIIIGIDRTNSGEMVMRR